MKTELVHYDSGAKLRAIWPLCGTPHLSLVRAPAGSRVVTCVECLGCAVLYGWSDHAP